MVHLSQTMRLEQRLSPQQILLSTLLQLPILNLEQKIQTELELNPVLEEGLEDEQELEPNDSETEETEEPQEENVISDEMNNGDLDLKELKEAQEDIDWDTMLNDDESYEIRIPRDKNDEEYERPEVVVTTMTEYLLEQLNYLSLS
jgi:RNA polymerase sigma-54 factor